MNLMRRTFQRLAGHKLTGNVASVSPDSVGVRRTRIASGAATLRAVSGAPLGLAPSAGSRRGTVLIIVLGTLALIAVIAVTYAVVGRADRRASAAFVGSVQREEMPALVRDYIADIVGKDAIATYRDGGGLLRREAFDYPFTDPMFRSVQDGPLAVPTQYRSMARFTPEGSFSDELTSQPTLGQLSGWGSLGTPYAILIPSDPWLASTQATDLRSDDNDPGVLFTQYHMRDWGNISNVAPDGRFVNLFNLRNNFDAASGFDDGDDEISSKLSLYDDNGDPGSTVLDNGEPASPNIPNHWTSRQRGAFRPATGIPTIGWDNEDHPSYQWADADGDGFYDARWFEFIDLTQGVDDPRAIFPADPNYRWFAAVRVVDLSAAVNVNTATDFLADAGAATPNYLGPGNTPADIDLRRLLTGEDTRELAGIPAPLGAYAGLRPPSVAGNPGSVNTASAQYTAEILQYNTDPQNAEWIGDAAYNSFRYFLEFGLVPPPQIRLEPNSFPDFITYVDRQHGFRPSADSLLRPQSILERSELYNTITGQGTDLSVSLFGIDSEGELLTYRGANDPSFTSTLELVGEGRLGDAFVTTRHGPFRSSRDLAVEVAQRDQSSDGPSLAFGTLGDQTPDGVADLDAMTQVLVDLRQYVTTLSAARPFRNSILDTASPLPPLGVNDLPLDISSSTPPMNSLFKIYADALLPNSNFIETWLPPTDPLFEQYRTLSYGHAGSELALRHAAHMAVNMADAIDTNNTISVATVLVDENVRDALNADYDPPPPSGQQPTGTVYVKSMGASGVGRDNPWAAWVDGGQFDLTADRLADTGSGSAVLSPAVNVYGVEAQPFIAEVAGFVLYTDAPSSAGGDTEAATFPITIDGTINGSNPDLAYLAVAFQLTNPFATSISLAGNSDAEFNYYIEFGDRFYRFPLLDPGAGTWNGTLGAHETRVFYVPARPRQDDVDRWNAINTGSGGSLPAALIGMMGVNGGQPVQLAEFNPLNGVTFAFNAGGAEPGTFIHRLNPATDISQVRLWRTQLASGATSGGTAAETYAQNARENDILADHLKDPGNGTGDPTLELLLNLGGDEVTGSAVPVDDTGFSVLLWGAIQRPSDPDAPATAASDILWLPAYCVENKFGTSMNLGRDDGNSRTTLNVGDFGTGEQTLANTFSNMVSNLSTAASVDTLVMEANEKTTNLIASNRQGTSWSDLRTEMYQGLGDTAVPGTRALRPFDMLLARGIGASLEIGPSLNYDVSGWTTIGQATALALDYDVGTAGTNLMWSPGRAANSPAGPGSLDRGHILADRFVPFLDVSSSNPPVFDPADDYAFGDGMPLAMGIVEAFRSLGDQYGNHRRPTAGLININTAPLAVLRTLPMLSPSHGADPSTFATSAPTGWWGDATGQGLTSDAATMLEAYRDNVTRVPRGDAQGNPPVAPNDLIDFESGRRFRSDITAIREIPGFRSLGEVLGARDGEARIGVNPIVPGLHDIDRLGYDGVALNLLGFDPAVLPGGGVDAMTDELDERYALVNSIANTVTVRSDVYAVWFVLHGYRESDCTGLAQDDPLIPGVSRRFLMILDRSNVMTTGDKPAILLFKEVPYSPTSAGDGSAI